jgi:hypothetical protein
MGRNMVGRVWLLRIMVPVGLGVLSGMAAERIRFS